MDFLTTDVRNKKKTLIKKRRVKGTIIVKKHIKTR